MRASTLLAGVGITATLGAGGLTAAALSQTGSQVPTKTVTIDVAKGEKGPPGPAGPKGEAGDPTKCPNSSTFGKLVINHPGGQTSIFTCIVD